MAGHEPRGDRSCRRAGPAADLKARALGARLNDPKVMAAAGAATKTQVGPLNFERWLRQRGGLFWTEVTIGPIEYTEDKRAPGRQAEDPRRKGYPYQYGQAGFAAT